MKCASDAGRKAGVGRGRKRRYTLICAMVMLAGIAVSARASTARATKGECVEFVGKAVAYLKSHSAKTALPEFNDPKGQFIDRDLYIVVYDERGTTLAHGQIPALAGKNRLDEQDADGLYYNRRRIELAETDANFWVFYRFSDPVTHKLLRKATYCETTHDPGYGKLIICSGTYEGAKASP